MLYRIEGTEEAVVELNRRYPGASAGYLDGMYVGDLTPREAREAQQTPGINEIRRLTGEEHWRILGKTAVHGFTD